MKTITSFLRRGIVLLLYPFDLLLFGGRGVLTQTREEFRASAYKDLEAWWSDLSPTQRAAFLGRGTAKPSVTAPAASRLQPLDDLDEYAQQRGLSSYTSLVLAELSGEKCDSAGW